MTEKQIKDFQWALETAWKECKDPYAQTYLRAMERSAVEYGKHGVSVQILYALSNMQSWRGETAKKVKAIFKETQKLLEAEAR